MQGKCSHWHAELRNNFASRVASVLEQLLAAATTKITKLAVPISVDEPFVAAETFALVGKVPNPSSSIFVFSFFLVENGVRGGADGASLSRRV